MILAATLLVLLWGLAAARLPTLWRDQRQRLLWAAVAALAVSRTVAFPPVAERLAAPAAQHLAAVIAASFLLRFILLATGGRGRRWHLAAGGVLLALLGVAAAALSGIGVSPGLLNGDLTPFAVAYWVVLDAYLGVVLLSATALFRATGADAPPGLPRMALRTIAVGTALLAVDAFFRAFIMVALGFGVPVDLPAIAPVAEAVQAASLLLTVSGGVAASYPRTRAAVAAYRSLLALRPLWTAMRDAFPEVILFSPRRALIELAGVDDVHLRLYRRVIEIRDGMLALREYRPEGLDAAGDSPSTEAYGIALALARRAAGEPPAERPGSWAAVGPEMADEVAWLRRVSAAYRQLRGRELTAPAAPTPRPSGSAR